MVSKVITTGLNISQNTGFAPGVLTAIYSLFYFSLPPKPFCLPRSLAPANRSSLYGGCKRMDRRDLSIR